MNDWMSFAGESYSDAFVWVEGHLPVLFPLPTFPVAEGLVAGVSNLVGYVFGGK